MHKKLWIKAAIIRSVKTFAQTLLGIIVTGVTFADIDWKIGLSIALVAMIGSLLTSIAGLPEVDLQY